MKSSRLHLGDSPEEQMPRGLSYSKAVRGKFLLRSGILTLSQWRNQGKESSIVVLRESGSSTPQSIERARRTGSRDSLALTRDDSGILYGASLRHMKKRAPLRGPVCMKVEDSMPPFEP
jgi:hypothetical protein